MLLGQLRVTLNGGRNQTLKDKEKYLVKVVMPDKVSKTGSFATSKASPASLDWNANTVFDIVAPLTAEMKLTLVLYEAALLMDRHAGDGTFDFAPLFAKDARRIQQLVTLSDEKGVALCDANIDCSWEGNVPAFITGGPAGAAGAAAAGGSGGGTTAVIGAPMYTMNESGEPVVNTAPVVLAPLPPCEGRAYSVRVMIRKAVKLQATSDTKLYDPLVTVTIGDDTQRTDFEKGVNEPVFDAELSFVVPKADASFWNMPINVSVMDHNIGRPNSLIGMTQLEMQAVYRNPSHMLLHKWFILRKGQQIMGFLKMTVMVLDALNDQIPEVDDDPNDGDDSEDALMLNLVNTPGGQFEETYMRCELHRAEGIPQMDTGLMGNKADPFVKVAYGIKKVKTSHLNDTFDPQWNTVVMLAMQEPAMIEALTVSMWDHDSIGSNKIIATHKLLLSELAGGPAGKPPAASAAATAAAAAKAKLAAKGGEPAAGAAAGADDDDDDGKLRSFPLQFVNFYGCPRSCYKEKRAFMPRYFDNMNKGLAPGVDYRGRLLLRLAGSRDPNCTNDPIAPRSPSLMISFTVFVEGLQFSMLQEGHYHFTVSCGCGEDVAPVTSATKSARKRDGSATSLTSVFFNETVRLNHRLECVYIPGAPGGGIAKQLPDVIVHLYNGKSMYAALRMPVEGLMGGEAKELALKGICRSMRVLSDPDKVSEGEQPCDPLGQVRCAFFVTKAEPLPLQHKSLVALTDEQLGAIRVATLPTLSPSPSSSVPHILEVCVYRGMSFPAGDANGLSDPFVRVSWANGAAETGHKLETLNPIYDEMLCVHADACQPFPDIVIELWDWDLIGSNTFLAKAVMPIDAAIRTTLEKEWVEGFTDSRGRPLKDAKVLVCFEVRRPAAAASPTALPRMTSFSRRVGSNDSYRGLEIPARHALELSTYTLDVNLWCLRKMRPFRLLSVKNSHVEVIVADTVIKFQPRAGVNPDYNQSARVVLKLPKVENFWPAMNFRVYDKRIGPQSMVGAGALTLTTALCSPSGKEAARVQSLDAYKTVQVAIARFKEERFARLVAPAAAPPLAPALPDGGVSAAALATPAAAAAVPQSALYAASSLTVPTTGKWQGHSRRSGAGEEVNDTVEMGASAAVLGLGDAAKSEQAFITAQQARLQLLDSKDPDDNTVPLGAKKPADLPWYERWDADEELQPKAFAVARLGKIDQWFKDSLQQLPCAEPTAEAFFGPFTDSRATVALRRGWGKAPSRAGELQADVTLVETPSASLTVMTGGKIRRTEPIAARASFDFELHVYVIACRHLTPTSSSIFGASSANPYIALTLTNGSGSDKSDVRVSLRDQGKFQTLNPDYFLVRTIRGKSSDHSLLTVAVLSNETVGSDDLIGRSQINLEDRWFSERGYQKARGGPLPVPAVPAADGSAPMAMVHFVPGSYTEKRTLRDDSGQIKGSVELWVDMFAAPSRAPVQPPPIDISPPPPIEMELRTIVWNVRDVILNDVETDIYVRSWLDGLRHDMQQTDVHYRSLDGSGNFNWRMNFRFVFEPRSKKLMPVAKKASSLASWFRIRREERKSDPVMRVQVFDNSLFPGMDNYIGEATINLLKAKPVLHERNKQMLLLLLLQDAGHLAESLLCCRCCKPKKRDLEDLTLEEKQQAAVDEFKADQEAERLHYEDVAASRVEELAYAREHPIAPAVPQPPFTLDETNRLLMQFAAEARRKARINIFEQFTASTSERRKANKYAGDVAELPAVSETAKYWFTARGPKGACRVGDVQLSFQLVRIEALEKDEKLAAGKGRSEPQALPDPNRPASSFFWLTSPFKSAIHILLRRYWKVLVVVITLLFIAIFLFLFLTEGVQVKADQFFSHVV